MTESRADTRGIQNLMIDEYKFMNEMINVKYVLMCRYYILVLINQFLFFKSLSVS